MFILYAIPIGIIAGYLLGGRLDGLAEIPFRWGWLAVAGLLVQVLLFAEPVAATIGAAGTPIYLASTAAVLIAVLRNLRIPGIPLVALGAASNLLAILANGGVMPASPEAVAALEPEAAGILQQRGHGRPGPAAVDGHLHPAAVGPVRERLQHR